MVEWMNECIAQANTKRKPMVEGKRPISFLVHNVLAPTPKES